MINKENKDKDVIPESKEKSKEDSGFIDIANMDVQCHLFIKDKDTGEILVNQRG